MKTLAEHPESRFSLSQAGAWRFNIMREQLPYRNPETFGMMMFSDYPVWGTIEVIENLILDFNEATDWREQWAVCEALIMFLRAEELNAMGWCVIALILIYGLSSIGVILGPRNPLIS
jgi:hypothetical protein